VMQGILPWTHVKILYNFRTVRYLELETSKNSGTLVALHEKPGQRFE